MPLALMWSQHEPFGCILIYVACNVATPLLAGVFGNVFESSTKKANPGLSLSKIFHDRIRLHVLIFSMYLDSYRARAVFFVHFKSSSVDRKEFVVECFTLPGDRKSWILWNTTSMCSWGIHKIAAASTIVFASTVGILIDLEKSVQALWLSQARVSWLPYRESRSTFCTCGLYCTGDCMSKSRLIFSYLDLISKTWTYGTKIAGASWH